MRTSAGTTRKSLTNIDILPPPLHYVDTSLRSSPLKRDSAFSLVATTKKAVARRETTAFIYKLDAAKLRGLQVERAQLLFDAIEEDSGSIVDGIVEDRSLLLLFGDQSVVLVEELDAGNDDTSKQGKLKYAHEAAKETVYPPEADGLEQLRHEPSHQIEEQGHNNQNQHEGGDVSRLDRHSKGGGDPRPYGHIEGAAEKQTADEASKACHLLHQSVAQAADEAQGEEDGDDNINCFHVF